MEAYLSQVMDEYYGNFVGIEIGCAKVCEMLVYLVNGKVNTEIMGGQPSGVSGKARAHHEGSGQGTRGYGVVLGILGRWGTQTPREALTAPIDQMDGCPGSWG
jgi:hypothetical protein